MKTLLSNTHRECSLSIRSVELEAAGGEDALGYRTVKGRSVATGFATGDCADDPLEVLIREEILTFGEEDDCN